MRTFRNLVWLLVLAGLLSLTAFAFERVKFAVISDPHLSLPAVNTENRVKIEDYSVELFREAIEVVNSIHDLDFVLLLGDLTKDAEPWNIDLLREMLEEVKVPVFAVLGNHDVSPIPVKGSEPSVASLVGSSKYTSEAGVEKFLKRNFNGWKVC